MNKIWENIFRKDEDPTQNILNVLKRNILFRDLTRSELIFVQNIVHIRQYEAGELIFKQGEIGVGMYLIAKGRVEIFITDPTVTQHDHQDIYIAHLTEGDFFGELSLVEDNGPRSASAMAREGTTLIGFFKPDLMEILDRNPATGVKIVFRLAEVLGRRLKDANESVSDLRKSLKILREPPPINKI